MRLRRRRNKRRAKNRAFPVARTLKRAFIVNQNATDALSGMSLSTNNRVLLSLPADARAEVLGACEPSELEKTRILDAVGETTRRVYFPETAVISTVATYGDGSMIEMANVGREACTGINLTLGTRRQLNTNEVQIAGAARMLSAEQFLRLKQASPDFERALLATAQAVFYQVMVSGACNGAHSAKQRLARWLLTMRDRTDEADMPLTQSFLAEMLGVRRATVTEAASDLQGSGLIKYARGRVSITDREGLIGASCECYELVQRAYATLLPAGKGTA